MLFFSKKVNEKTISDIEEIVNKYEDEFNKCYVPLNALNLWYLEGNNFLDNLYGNELENFDLSTLYDYKNTTLKNCLDEHPKVRKSFFYALNNIKQSKQLYYLNDLLDFLRSKGKMFVDNYLKDFQKSSNKYKKSIEKQKLPEYRNLLAWIEDDKLHFLDKLFVYLGKYSIPLDNIVEFYTDNDIARTVLVYNENNEVKNMNFNLSSFDTLEKLLPFKAKVD